MNITLSYDQIRNLVGHLRKPDYEFEAAAGPEFGSIQAWDIGNAYLVAISFDCKVDYAIIERLSDPADLIQNFIKNDIDNPIDRMINIANVHGINAIDAAVNEEAGLYAIPKAGPYAVLRTRYFQSERREVTCAVCDDAGEVQKFTTLAEARSFAKAQGYLLAPSECAKPKYTIVSIN